MDDVQVSCYRILNSLYFLGTNESIYVERYEGTFSVKPLFLFNVDHCLSISSTIELNSGCILCIIF